MCRGPTHRTQVALAMTAPPHRHDEWRPHPGVERRSRWRLRRHHLPSDTVDSPVRRGFWHSGPDPSCDISASSTKWSAGPSDKQAACTPLTTGTWDGHPGATPAAMGFASCDDLSRSGRGQSDSQNTSLDPDVAEGCDLTTSDPRKMVDITRSAR